ncbi:MAG: hypothetical protein DRH90_20980, partial [Deltaproteobacteria bacterium]
MIHIREYIRNNPAQWATDQENPFVKTNNTCNFSVSNILHVRWRSTVIFTSKMSVRNNSIQTCEGTKMDNTDKRYKAYLKILQEELIPAMGCTEPIAVAYAAARAREVLGKQPDRVLIEASDNIIKNVKSVVVPNTGNLRGIEASAVAGIVAGDADKVLEVISSVNDKDRKNIKTFLESKEIKVCKSKSNLTFDLTITVYRGESKASVRLS